MACKSDGFGWKDVSSFYQKVGNKLIKPHIRLPSKSKHGALEAQQQFLKKPGFLATELAYHNGVLNIPTERLIDELLPGSGTGRFDTESACDDVLKSFLYNTEFTLLCPEIYFKNCAVFCPHPECNSTPGKKCSLLFQKVAWTSPRLVLGITVQNQVVFPCVYGCAKGHTLNTMQPEYLELLPSIVQRKYPFARNSAIVVNSKCSWSILTSQSLEPVQKLTLSRQQFDFADRSEAYMLYVEQVSVKTSKFLKPPTKLYNSSAGGKVASFMNPSGKLLREIRQAARDCHKREIHASMQAVTPGKVLAVDSNYRNTKKTSSNSSATCTLLAKDGPDKGKILAYCVHADGESHNKSQKLYEGVAGRPGYCAEMCFSDLCCGGCLPTNLEDEPVKQALKLKHPAKGDPFHKIEAVSRCTLQSHSSAEHMQDFAAIFFNDVVTTEQMGVEYPGWESYWEHINLDSTLGSTFKWDELERQPDLYAISLLALAKCFVKKVKDTAEYKSSSEASRARIVLKETLKYIGRSHCRFIARRYRTKADSLKKYEEYVRKWFGMSSKELANIIEGKTPAKDCAKALAPEKMEDFQNLKEFSSANGEKYILLKSKQVNSYKSGKSERYFDGDDVCWHRSTDPALGGSRMFSVGLDSKILGKSGIAQEVVNLGSHLRKGCFDYKSENHGLEFFQRCGKPLTKGQFKGLQQWETAIGTNALEAFFRVLNLSTALTTTLGDSELEPRLDFCVLEENFKVDRRNKRNDLPNAIYWRWSRLNSISRKVFDSDVFKFKDPMKFRYEEEPFLGFGAYRYETAIIGRDVSPEAAEKVAINGFEKNLAKNRWVYHSKLRFTKADNSSASNVTSTKDAAATTLQANGTAQTHNDALQEAAMFSQTAAAKEPEGAAKEPKAAIAEETEAGVAKERVVAHAAENEPKVATLKRKRISAGGSSTSAPAKKKKKSLGSRRVGNKKNFMRSFLAKVAPVRTAETEELVQNAVCEALAKSPQGKVNVERVSEQAAAMANRQILQSHKDTQIGVRRFPNFVNSTGVRSVMHKDATAIANRRLPQSSRNKYRAKPIESLYPITRAEVLSGVTLNRAQRILRDLKKNWKAEVCSSKRGLRTSLPKNCSTGKATKEMANYGLRKLFQSMQLLKIGRSSEGKFTSSFATTQFAFFDRLTGSVQTEATVTFNTVLHEYEPTSAGESETSQP